ncbi:MAG: NifU family protein [Bacteroidia bacterium]
MSSSIRQRVEDALNTIRPYLEADGGNVQVVSLNDNNELTVELTGACKTCGMRHMTMKSGIEETVKKAVPEITKITAIPNQ